MKNLLTILSANPVIPVMVIEQLQHALPLAEALAEGGLTTLEITMRTNNALEALTQIKQHFPHMHVGAGTVLNAEHLQSAHNAGADFLVSPGFTAELLSAAIQKSVNLLPGASTPAEAMQLLDMGFLYQKFFPAEAAGGVAMLKAIAGPMPHIKFCPTGGISQTSAKDYLALNNVVCVGGSWMLNSSDIKNENWQKIKQLAQQARSLK